MTVAVIGSGTMGRGIALAAASYGCDVMLFDSDSGTAQRAADFIAGKLRAGSSTAGSNAANGETGQVRIAPSVATAAAGADTAIEAVVEAEPIKAGVLSEMAAAIGPGTLLATNTSTFSIARLAAAAGCEGRLIGMHFFNPAEKMRLVEVVVPAGLPETYVRRASELAELLGKTPIIVRDSPGFITSRMGLALGNEAMRVVESGVASPQAVDAAMRLGYNHPMGPLELADLVGLDARLNNLNALHAALAAERFAPPHILIEMVEAGHLGRKTGHGFYRYDENGRKADVAPNYKERGTGSA